MQTAKPKEPDMPHPKRSFAFAQSDVDSIVESIDAKANEFADPVGFVELLQSELAYLKNQLEAQEEYEGA